MDPQRSPPDVKWLSSSVFEAARAYLHAGWSVVPLQGKRPTIRWRPLQQRPATEAQLRTWHGSGLLQNVGIACGKASRNLVVLDIDAEAGYSAFRAAFPLLVDNLHRANRQRTWVPSLLVGRAAAGDVSRLLTDMGPT